MKTLTILSLLTFASIAQAANKDKILLQCAEKWSTFTIKQVNGKYVLERSQYLEMDKGQGFVGGNRKTETKATLEKVVSVEKDENSLIFNLEDEQTITVTLEVDEDEEEENIVIEADDEELQTSIDFLLGTSDLPLNFTSESCAIKI